MNQQQMFEAFQAFMNAQSAAPAAPKAETPKDDAIMVINSKTDTGVKHCNVLLSKMPATADLKRANDTWDQLALAALAGHAWPEGMIKITPKGNLSVDPKSGIASNYRSMVKKIAAVSPQKRREAWAAYVETLDKFHGIKFTALYKAILKASRPEKIAKPPLRDLIKMVLEGSGKAADKLKEIKALIEEAESKSIKAK